MKKSFMLGLMTVVFILSSCSSVPVGSVGVKVNKFGGDKGVAAEVLGVAAPSQPHTSQIAVVVYIFIVKRKTLC